MQTQAVIVIMTGTVVITLLKSCWQEEVGLDEQTIKQRTLKQETAVCFQLHCFTESKFSIQSLCQPKSNQVPLVAKPYFNDKDVVHDNSLESQQGGRVNPHLQSQ